MVTAQITLAAAWVIDRPSGWFSLAGQPGQTALTRMPSRASSAASSRVSALSAALDTLYAGEPPVITEIEPPSLLTFTILGRVLERSIGSRASITRQGPNRLTSIASATVPRSALLAVAHRSYMVDALFTSTSVRPNWFFTHSAMPATLTELSTSSWQATMRIPSGSSSLAASSPRRRSREPSTTEKPSRASCRHTSRPTPRLPPVTTATGWSAFTRITSAGRDRDVSHASHLATRPSPPWPSQTKSSSKHGAAGSSGLLPGNGQAVLLAASFQMPAGHVLHPVERLGVLDVGPHDQRADLDGERRAAAEPPAEHRARGLLDDLDLVAEMAGELLAVALAAFRHDPRRGGNTHRSRLGRFRGASGVLGHRGALDHGDDDGNDDRDHHHHP